MWIKKKKKKVEWETPQFSISIKEQQDFALIQKEVAMPFTGPITS